MMVNLTLVNPVNLKFYDETDFFYLMHEPPITSAKTENSKFLDSRGKGLFRFHYCNILLIFS